MKTQTIDHPSLDTTWQRLSLVFLLLPLYVGIAQFTMFGLTDRILYFSGYPVTTVVLSLMAGLCLLSLGLAVLRGRFSATIASLALAVMVMFAIPSHRLYPMLKVDAGPGISIGERDPSLYGTDVYCNDVHLGQAPIRLSMESFLQQVPSATAPPKHTLALTPQDSDSDIPQADWWMSHALCDPFQVHRAGDTFSLPTPGRPDAKSLGQKPYWWRFERNGMTGLTRNQLFGWVNATDEHGRPASVAIAPEVAFPQVEPHVALLLQALRATGGQPSDEWRDHVQQYWGLLFPKLHARSARDLIVEHALHAVVGEQYGIHEEMSQEEAADSFERILSQVEESGMFVVPSAESIAIDLLGERASEAIEREYGRLSDVPRQPRYVRERRGNSENAFLGSGKSVRIPPLEYAILRNPPADLLNQIIYDEMTARWPAISLVACYPQPEAVNLVTGYLQMAGYGLGESVEQRKALLMQAIPEIRNPELDLFIYDFMRQSRIPIPTGPMIEFIESRLDATWTDGAQLYEWFIRRLPEREQIRYLTRLRSPHTGNYLRNVVRNDAEIRQEAIAYLARHPNPGLDEFLIEACEQSRGADGVGGISSDLIQAMLLNDTPRMRAYLDEMWGQDTGTQLRMLDGLASLEPSIPKQMHWLPLFSELNSTGTQLLAIPVASQIGTPEALALLEHWRRSANAGVKQMATDHLAVLQERTRQAERLIAGAIHPSELLPTIPTYVWSGEEYIREGEAVPRVP